MIAYLRGILAQVELDHIIVEVGGIGYQVHVHTRTFSHLPAVGHNVLMHTYLQISENEYRLFGFLDKEEIKLFEHIISVSGIGAKAGLSILSAMDSQRFCSAIVAQDEKSLMAIPGIGKKSAGRLIFELKDKVSGLVSFKDDTSGANLADLMEALEVLGYKSTELLPIINELADQGKLDSDTGRNVKLVLQRINLKNS